MSIMKLHTHLHLKSSFLSVIYIFLNPGSRKTINVLDSFNVCKPSQTMASVSEEKRFQCFPRFSGLRHHRWKSSYRFECEMS